MNEVTITVTLEEAVAIVNLVGSTPVHQGGAALWEKLKAQVEPLIPTETEPAE